MPEETDEPFGVAIMQSLAPAIRNGRALITEGLAQMEAQGKTWNPEEDPLVKPLTALAKECRDQAAFARRAATMGGVLTLAGAIVPGGGHLSDAGEAAAELSRLASAWDDSAKAAEDLLRDVTSTMVERRDSSVKAVRAFKAFFDEQAGLLAPSPSPT
ncbi:MAG: hypothetical protein L3K18_08670 [Thermoplasmata archaeon]|nr:hypothetical protein [Thermoplasmata archaeon]